MQTEIDPYGMKFAEGGNKVLQRPAQAIYRPCADQIELQFFYSLVGKPGKAGKVENAHSFRAFRAFRTFRRPRRAKRERAVGAVHQERNDWA